MASLPDRRRFSSFFGAVTGRLLSGWLARWRKWTSPDRYRPEKHYMRGPGPKNLGPKNLGPKNSGKTGGGDSKAA
jgi:hypothetical protein